MTTAFTSPRHPARWAFLFLILAAAYAHHRWVYIPWRGEREDLETRLVLITAEIYESSQALLAEESTLENHVAHLSGRLHSLESRLPDPPSIQHLPAWIQTTARNGGLRLVSLRPEPVHSEGLYAEERFHVIVEGRYHAVGRFLSSLGSSPHLLKVSELRMMSVQDHSLVRATLGIDTYVRPWMGPVAQVTVTSLFSNPDDPVYPAEPLPDPLELSPHDLRHLRSSDWPRLRTLFLASDPRLSMAAFEDPEEPGWDGRSRRRLIRVRIGDRIGSATVVGIDAHGVEVRRDGEEAVGRDPEVIALEPGRRIRPPVADPDLGTQP